MGCRAVGRVEWDVELLEELSGMKSCRKSCLGCRAVGRVVWDKEL